MSVEFRKRRRGVVDGYVGGRVVATLKRSRGSWTASVYGEDEVEATSFAEARALVRLSPAVRAAVEAAYPQFEGQAQSCGIGRDVGGSAPVADEPSEWQAFWRR